MKKKENTRARRVGGGGKGRLDGGGDGEEERGSVCVGVGELAVKYLGPIN